MRKSLLTIAGILFVTLTASAKTTSTTSTKSTASIPSDATIITSASDSYNSYLSSSDAKMACDKALFDLRSKLSQKAAQLNVQYTCKKVIFSKQIKAGYCSGNCGWDGYSDYYAYSVDIAVYCQPRSLREKQIISAQRNCEQQPTAQCWDPNYLAALESVKSTEFAEIGDSCQ